MNMRFVNSAVLAGILVVSSSAAMADFFEDFTDDPVAGGRAVIDGGNVSHDTAYAFVVSTPGTLTQNLHTNWDWANYGFGPRGVGQGTRLSFDLGKTYTEADSFSFGATLTIKGAGFAPAAEQMMALAFGLTNSITTGMDRSGAWTGQRDAFDSVEWNFFPNESDYGWPTLQQTVVGSQLGDGDSMFWNFAANFNRDDAVDGGFDTVLSQEKADPEHPLSGNYYGLPLDMAMSVTMMYDGAAKTVSMLITNAATGDVLVDNVTTTPDLDIAAPIGGFGSASGFSVDSFSLMNYQDGWAFGAPTLIATVEYGNAWFAETQSAPAPEPGSVLAVGALGLMALRRRRS